MNKKYIIYLLVFSCCFLFATHGAYRQTKEAKETEEVLGVGTSIPKNCVYGNFVAIYWDDKKAPVWNCTGKCQPGEYKNFSKNSVDLCDKEGQWIVLMFSNKGSITFTSNTLYTIESVVR